MAEEHQRFLAMLFKNLRVIWVVVFFLISLIGIIMGVHALHKVMVYQQLDVQTVGVVDGGTVEKAGSNKYLIKGRYHYFVKNARYEGISSLCQDRFLNHYSAQEEIAKYQNKSRSVFYNKKYPSVSSLEKVFPIKDVVYCLITIFIGGYFFFLKLWVERNKNP